MNKLLAGIGLLLIASGIMLGSASKIAVNRPKAHVVATSKKSWSVCGNLTAGDKIVIGFYPNFEWAKYTDINDQYPYGYVEVILDIIDPHGNVTRFLWPWAKPVSGAGFLLQDPTNIKIVSNGSLIDPGFVEIGAFGGCGGIIKYPGLYNVSASLVWGLHKNLPPSAIQIVKEIWVKTEPYQILLPIGTTFGILGIFPLVYGMKFAEKRSKSLIKKRRNLKKRR